MSRTRRGVGRKGPEEQTASSPPKQMRRNRCANTLFAPRAPDARTFTFKNERHGDAKSCAHSCKHPPCPVRLSYTRHVFTAALKTKVPQPSCNPSRLRAPEADCLFSRFLKACGSWRTGRTCRYECRRKLSRRCYNVPSLRSRKRRTRDFPPLAREIAGSPIQEKIPTFRICRAALPSATGPALPTIRPP